MNTTQKDVFLREKVIRIFKYLKDLALLKSKIKRDLSEYERVAWFHEVPELKGCFSIIASVSDEIRDGIWLELKKPVEPKKPIIPESCLKWINPEQNVDPLIEPILLNKIRKQPSLGRAQQTTDYKLALIPEEYEVLSSHPEVTRDWHRYLINQWRPWADSYELWKAADGLYFKLFWIHQQQKKLGEQYELVVGLGLLSWHTSNNQYIKRHMIVGDASLEFDADRAKFSIHGAPDGIKLRFETEMIEPNDLPNLEKQKELEELLAQVQEDPWNKNEIGKILRSWVHLLSPEGKYLDELFPSQKTPINPTISFSPAIILRRRTERGQIHCFNKVIEQMNNGDRIPEGVKLLCEIARDDSTTADDSDYLVKPSLNDELQYLPLEINDEQIQILHQLNTRRGILVQGPPGTGKSHTIANLICHLLAQRKKVLITSQTPRALKVLKDKIPDELKALCVVLLGNDQESRRELEDSVQNINTRYSNWSPAASKSEINHLETELRKIKKDIIEKERLLRESREIESYEHIIAGGYYKGTVQKIAEQIKINENRFSWFVDDVADDAECPLSNLEMKELLALYEELTVEIIDELNLIAVKISDIPSVDEFIAMVEEESSASRKWGEYKDLATKKRFQILERLSDQERRGFSAAVSSLATAMGGIRNHFPWVQQAIIDILNENDKTWKELENFTKSRFKDLETKAAVSQGINLYYPPTIDRNTILSDSKQLLEHFVNGGKLGWKIFAPEIVKKNRYIIKTVKLNGNSCCNKEQLKLLINYLETVDTIDQIWSAWAGKDKREEASFIIQVGNLKERLESLQHITGLEAYLDVVKEFTKKISGLPEPHWYNLEEINDILSELNAIGCWKAYSKIKEKLNEIATRINLTKVLPNSHKINNDIQSAIISRNVSDYARYTEKIRALDQTRKQLLRKNLVQDKFKEYAPKLKQQLRDNYLNPDWEKRTDEMTLAWSWKRADKWLRIFNTEHDGTQNEFLLKGLNQKQRELTSRLASAKSWQNCLETLTEFQRQNLIAWALAIKRYGKGTGKYAPLYLKQAQSCMDNCKGAIPAWIMPLYRVFETVSPQPEMFDVVIIDEASQTGPEGMILQYLGKQIIVVGDSEQISPEAVGIDREAVYSLIAKHLKDIPHNDNYNPETSFFNHAEIRYPGRVVLREHFRCMPEIIQFSNDLCYKLTPLKPLRQYPPNRLEPIMDCYIKTGSRDGTGGKAINRTEADELVKKIISICSLPTYKDKTIGVISLQGEEQAKYIDTKLISSMPANEIQKRRIICGDAYAFQGDERDIMFLSMVAAPNERIGSLAGDAAKRRFNVAASRAKDQVWLFHSVTLNDLNPECMRYKLLKYYLDPKVQQFEIDITKCESQFEKDVFQAICQRRYRVIPQFGVAGYRIDFVIEGAKNRLAVECDGDPWHGIEQFEKDIARQRILERCGWRFWRIRGSEYYRDPDGSLIRLWQMLEEMNIQPEIIMQNKPADTVITKDYLEEANGKDNIRVDHPEKSDQKNATGEIPTKTLFQSPIQPKASTILSRFEDSIRTPFPDEYTPALTFLRDANRLEKEGAPQEQIDEAIKLARIADGDATSLYLTRWEIIKRRNSGK